MSTAPNFDSMSLEELRAAADAELSANPDAIPTVSTTNGQLRNADGTFAAAEVTDPAQNPPEEGVSVEEVTEQEEQLDPGEVIHDGELVYRLEVPGEDGSGSEVFYGHGPDFMSRYRDAVEQLRQAKVHANRKIRSITKEQKATAQMTEDERYILKQRMQTEPDKAIEEIIERRLNSDPRIKAAEQVSQAQQINDVTNAWVAANPDFHANEVNGKRMWAEMKRNGVNGVPTKEDITRAYNTLNNDGLLQAKPAAQSQAVAAPAPVRRGSGMSARSATSNVPTARNLVPGTNHTQAELDAMTLDQLRAAGGGGSGW